MMKHATARLIDILQRLCVCRTGLSKSRAGKRDGASWCLEVKRVAAGQRAEPVFDISTYASLS